jgi:hypothetical protein
MKYQDIVILNDLIVYFGGPFEDRLNDIIMLRESGLEQKFEEIYKKEKENEYFFFFENKTFISFTRIIFPFSRKYIESYKR